MELRVAAEAGLERGLQQRVARTASVQAQETLDAFALPESGEADARLLLEEPA